ncbi:hypothetical protein Taqua_01556 [Tepidimonas aquatica]|uniref:DUF4845 domain-containing protein n=2 Tax=Tepidimonas aquatica TaxID=247482 RepID=A0A554WLE7_9BURK|nr:hypothetical protein Taqua_01556 [Tepidimonas aquatica]
MIGPHAAKDAIMRREGTELAGASASGRPVGVTMKRQQRGVSVIGMVLVGIILALVVVLAAKVVPTVTEYWAIQKAVNRAAQSGTTVTEIRNAFERAKTADYFEAISGKDLDISKDGDNIVVEFAYDKEIHLFGPAYLVLKYRGRSQ